MVEFMYRYRSAEATLATFNELENGMIFFPELKDLNDPLEGFYDLFWQGDEIVWENLFLHYAYVLMLRCLEHFAKIPECETHNFEVLAQNTPQDIQDPELSELFQSVSSSFIDEKVIQKLIKILAKERHELRRDGLIQLMGLFQPILLSHLITHFRDGDYNRKLFNQSADIDVTTYQSISDLARQKLTHYVEHHRLINAPSGVFAISTNMLEQLQLIKEASLLKDNINHIWQRLILHLPSKYVTAMEAAMYPKWFTACFSTEPVNSSMWGMYANCHKGVC